MITTLPGLYIWTSMLLRAYNLLFTSDMCTLFWFRFINVVFSLFNLIAIFLTLRLKLKSSEVLTDCCVSQHL